MTATPYRKLPPLLGTRRPYAQPSKRGKSLNQEIDGCKSTRFVPSYLAYEPPPRSQFFCAASSTITTRFRAIVIFRNRTGVAKLQMLILSAQRGFNPSRGLCGLDQQCPNKSVSLFADGSIPLTATTRVLARVQPQVTHQLFTAVKTISRQSRRPHPTQH